MDIVVNHVKDAVLAVLDGRQEEARAALRAIDFRALNEIRDATRSPIWGLGGLAMACKSPFPGVRRQDMRATFARDGYTCRYCSRPTIALEVLKLLSKAFPDLLPYHPNWRPVVRHILYWTYSTSLEHIESFPSGGTSCAGNLLTACYLCNDFKNYLPLDLLGWTDVPPAQTGWLGLTEYISELRKSATGRSM